MKPIQFDLVKVVREIEDQNRISVVSPEEVLVLFQGERRSNPSGMRPIWDEAMRLAKRQLAEECE